uniref:Uncharacterized protein n=1 Tax=Arundo donax TaxID=35708 RepID=A0A0A9FAM7_ARUDO
MSTIVSFLAAS